MGWLAISSRLGRNGGAGDNLLLVLWDSRGGGRGRGKRGLRRGATERQGRVRRRRNKEVLEGIEGEESFDGGEELCFEGSGRARRLEGAWLVGPVETTGQTGDCSQ